MAIQKRNDEAVNLSGADFQKRYESGFAWRTACSMYQALTGLRGFWPMSAVSATGAAFDLSGNGRTLTYNGAATYDYDGLAPYYHVAGAGFLSRADEVGLDILGTEAYIAAGHRGLTLGGWFSPQDNTVADSLIAKWGAAGQRSYILQLRGDVAGDPIEFYMSDDGTASSGVQSTNGFTINTWHFMAARFNDADAGAELAIWLDDTMTPAATARAAIFNSNAALYIGSDVGAANLYNGRTSMCFLCAAALADATIWALYQHTRALFKV